MYLNDDLNIKEQKNIQLEFNNANERLNLLKGEKKILELKIEKILNSKCDLIISKNEISDKIKYELNHIKIISNISQSNFEKSVKSLNGNIIDDLISIKNLNEQLSECDELIIERDENQRYNDIYQSFFFFNFLVFLNLNQKNQKLVQL